MKPVLMVITLAAVVAWNRLFIGRPVTGSATVAALMAWAIVAAICAGVSPGTTVYEDTWVLLMAVVRTSPSLSTGPTVAVWAPGSCCRSAGVRNMAW